MEETGLPQLVCTRVMMRYVWRIGHLCEVGTGYQGHERNRIALGDALSLIDL